MTRTYEEFEDARAIRHETLSLVAGLDQEQSEFRPGADKWSVGEVLDHLAKLDALIVRELEVAIGQRRRGLPFIYRSLADVDVSVPWVLRPVMPFVEIPFAFFNSAFPQSLRRSLTGSRRLPLQAPEVIKPRFGRPVEALRDALRKTFDVLEGQQTDHPEIDLAKVYYYNPITGLNSVAGMYRFVSNHEQRHHGQLRDILAAESFPRAA